MSTRNARRLVGVATAGGVAAAAGRWAPSIAAHAPAAARIFGVRVRFADLPGVVLTFDDGPHPRGTPAVLAELERLEARAIFFVTGEAVEREPRSPARSSRPVTSSGSTASATSRDASGRGRPCSTTPCAPSTP